MLNVWVENWQIECCGDPFGLGEAVRWSLVPESGSGEAVSLDTGESEVVRLTHRQEHHDALPDDAVQAYGIVTRVRAVFSASDSRRPGAMPAGAELAERVDPVNGGDSDQADRRFRGYIVELQTNGD